MGDTAILAGEKIGLFARTGMLSLNVSEGPVQIQAQNGEMHLSSEQKLSLISASDMLFAGKIEYGTDTTYTRKIKRSVTMGSATMPVKFPYLPGDGKYDFALNFFDGI